MTTSPARRAGEDGRPLAVAVLAAGKGTRLALGDETPPKVLLECLGVPLLEHVRRAVTQLAPDTVVVVTGHDAERVEAWLADSWPEALAVRQIPQEGTGQALRLALDAIPTFEGDVIVAYGDVPQVRGADLARLLETHRGADAGATVLSGRATDPGALGRIVRGVGGAFVEIVEARDAASRPEVLAVNEFNTGFYAFDADALRPALVDLSRANAQGEEYATEAVNRIAASGRGVASVLAEDPGALLGVNSFDDLAQAVSAVRRRIASEHMARGVHIVDPDTTVIEVDVEIAAGARILPFTHVGRGCRIGKGASVGPFARLRGGTVLEAGAEAGNFVEMKATRMGEGAKAKHLTYLGDADVGARANIGCGTVTANYDGKRKHKTTIEERASIGSGTILVAPVTVGAGARTGANAVVPSGRDVPPGETVVGVPAKPLPGAGARGEQSSSERDSREQEEQS